MKKSALLEKWNPLLNDADLPEIATKTKQEVVAQILENQEKDIHSDLVYQAPDVIDKFKGLLSEAVVSGDAGGDPAAVASGTNSGAVTNVGPAVMGFVRRAIPNMLAFDVCGVQPLSVSSGQVFTFRAMYGKNPTAADAREAFHPMNSINSLYSGAGTSNIADFNKTTNYSVGDYFKIERTEHGSDDLRFYSVVTAGVPTAPATGGTSDVDYVDSMIRKGAIVEISSGMATSLAELQEGYNDSTNNPWNEMSFRIDKQTVEAKERLLKASYSTELAQDLKNMHGMDADAELNQILASEILLGINREIVLWINATAQVGKSGWTNSTGSQVGVWNINNPLDNKGARWSGESYKALIIQIEKEANEISRQTGRGRGNFIICSRNVASVLGMTDMLIGPAAQGAQTGLNSDTNRSTFAGILAGNYKVYIDQYATEDYITVGYKGTGALDAGIVYAPYVALTPCRATNYNNFQPVIGFKTRYAVAVNPLCDPSLDKGSKINKLSSGMPNVTSFGKNCYFRKFQVVGL